MRWQYAGAEVKKGFWYLSFLLIFLSSGQGTRAQSNAPRFRFEHITVDDGLAHSDAMTVVQGSSGFIWIGTNNGIDRYDGYDLKHYQLPASEPTGVATNRMQLLSVDTRGKLWAGTENAGLYFYDPGKDQFVRPIYKDKSGPSGQAIFELNRSNVRSIVMDKAGQLWVATFSHGVFVLTLDGDGAVSRLSRVVLGQSGAANFDATSLVLSPAGKLWIGTPGEGLWELDPHAKEGGYVRQASRNNHITESDIRVLSKDRRGNFWIASNNYVYRLSAGNAGQAGNAIRLPQLFHGIQCLYSDSFGRLWIGSDFGLSMIEDVDNYLAAPGASGVHHYAPKDTDPQSINSGRIHQITEDSFGNLWLAASAGGVNKIRLQPKGFHHLNREVSERTTLSNNFVNAIARDDSRGQLWIGTRNGYSVYDEKTGTYRNFLSRAGGGNVTGTDVSSFCLIDGQMWIGTRYAGLYLSAADGQKAPVAVRTGTGLMPWNNMSIERIVTDQHGNVWVGTFGGGLNLFSRTGRLIRSFNRFNSPLPTSDISFLLIDPSRDVIWASTADQGVLKLAYRGGKLLLLNQFKHDPANMNSLQADFAWPLLRDRKGNIWIGTIGGGLHRLSVENGKETIRRYQHLVPDNDVESILADPAGNLWLAGSGLKRFNPETGELVRYDVSDGLQSNSFKVGASFHSAGGNMYFGGTNGVTWFKPEEIQPNPVAPLVRITGLRVLNKNRDATQKQAGSSMVSRQFSEAEGITIHAAENDFSFEFVGLNYINPRKQSYAFMMEGYSRDWIQLPAGQRVASFANLPAGDYVFRVKANNGEGVWSKVPASVRVKVLPPWWQTWWAYLLYIAAFSAALIWYKKLSTSRLKLENRLALEKLKADNEREMAEMKAAFFTSVSHEFRTPLTLILGPMQEFVNSLSESEAVREKARMMHKQTRKLLDLVNQLLSFRKVESGTMQLATARQDIAVFIKEIFSIFRIKADELRVDYQLHLPQQELPLYFDCGKMEVVITNLLSNAFKYTAPGGLISLSVRVIGSAEGEGVWLEQKLQDNYLEIAVSDTGKGIGEQERERIFDPYFQATNTRSDITGTGIGLALVRDFVKRHSGDVTVNSRVGAGTTFIIRLPFGKNHLNPGEIAEPGNLRPFAVEPLDSTRLSDATSIVGNKSLKLLIVEDNADLLQYLGGLFRDHFQVFLSADGAEGWGQALDILPDLIISDVNMPGLNGLELSRRIKQHLKTAHIPVILLTARAAAVQELEGLETGADDYIVKPFNEDILKAKVTTLLRNRNRLQEYYQRQILLQPTEIVIPDEDKLFLEKAMGIVEANLTDSDFNVQTLVSGMHMSQSVFYRRIKSITGQSVIEFIKDIRLKRAAQLLLNPHARAAEVGFMVGIEDPKNFRVSFQKLFGMSPTQYAKLHRSGEKAPAVQAED